MSKKATKYWISYAIKILIGCLICAPLLVCFCSAFKSEAEVAKKRGIKLYSQVNTGGKTWDFGVIPYEPFPYQWIKRYKEMEKAQNGLRITENKLKNEKFVANAPEAVVNAEREKKAKLEALIENLKESLKQLG